MRKTLFLFLSLFIAAYGWAQVVTTNPTFITETSGAVEVIFDATQGTAGLKDYTGTVYAHAGVITSSSISDSDWKYVLSDWGENLDKCKLTSLGNNKWKFVISPSIREFYGVAEGEEIKKLAFVFRSAEQAAGKDSYLEGKDIVGGSVSDIFIEVYKQGLNVSFASPAGSQSIKKGGSLDFVVNTSSEAKIELLLNSNVVKTEQSAASLSYKYTFASEDDYVFVAKASTQQQTVYDTIYVCVPKTATSAARPSGLLDGINYIDNSTTTFVLYAPKKKNVFLVGDFNDWVQLNSYQLKKDGDYWWYTLTDLDADKLYRFQYIVDDTIRISDPYTELVLDPWDDGWINSKHVRYPNLPAYPTGKASGHVATFQINKPAYNWEIKNFTMPSKTNMVIYELLLRDFTEEQSLQAAIDRLDYLDKLGVTAIELMPIQEFDGNNSWGYNPNHYFAPDKAYGSPELYKKFIDECHKRGIAVILDVVMNHATGAHPFAKLYWDSKNGGTAEDNPWFNVSDPHPFGVFHDFDHSQTRVREHFKRMLQYWIEEYKIDGYRLDLSKGFTQRNAEAYAKQKSKELGRTVSEVEAWSMKDNDRIAYLTEYYGAAKAKKPDVMFILEHFAEWAEEEVLASKGMYLWKDVNNAFSQSAMGWQSDSDFGGMNMRPRNWVSYGESHDEERNFYKAKTWGAGEVETDSIVRIKRVPLNMAFATLVPGPKMIWQFGEIGYDVKSGKAGDPEHMKEKPTGFHWYNNSEYRREAYYNTAKILNLRKQYPTAFNEGECALHIGYNDWHNGRRIAITHNDLNMVVIGNFKAKIDTDEYKGVIDAYPNFPKAGKWFELITGKEIEVTNTNMTMQLQPGEIRVYTDRKIKTPDMPDMPNGLPTPEKEEMVLIYPTVTDGMLFISTHEQINRVSVYSAEGKLVKTFGSDISNVDISELSGGLYFVEIYTSKGKEVQKIVKNR